MENAGRAPGRPSSPGRSSREAAGRILNVARALTHFARRRNRKEPRNDRETLKKADLLAKIFGFAFILVGIVGFIPDPLISETGFFQVNEARITSSIWSRALLPWPAPAGRVVDIRAIAVLYTIVDPACAIPSNPLFGAVAMNVADHWLHAALAAVLLLVGFAR